MTDKVYIGLGSNLGDRLVNLGKAISWIGQHGSTVIRQSGVYETAPWGYTEQPVFLNQVLEIDTTLQPFELLSCLKEGEADIGRVNNFHYGPRLIDMDILFYGQTIMETPVLTIPHLMINQRAFVLAPMAELAPDFIHPIGGLTIKELLASVDLSDVKKVDPQPKD